MSNKKFLDPLEAEKFKKQKCVQFCGAPCSNEFPQYCFWWKGSFVSVYFRDMHCDCFSSPSLISNPGMVSTIRFHKYNMELGMSDNMLGLKELFIDCSEIGSKRDKKTMQ